MDKKKAICEYLRKNHIGKENAIHSKELEKLFLLDGRNIRRKISALRQDGFPICSDETGYYYADNQKEINTTVYRLNELVTKVSNARTGLLFASILGENAQTVEVTIKVTELKTNAAKRSIPLPPRLLEALKEAKESSTSDYVIANKDGQPLTYTQFKRLWTYITTRTAKPRKARKFVGGKYVKYTIYPVLGEKARNNGKVVYSLDFEVTPHQLRHTYITNLIFASVDPKTVQYLAGHENSKITMDIYAKAKYNRPKDVAPMLEHVFNQWNEATTK